VYHKKVTQSPEKSDLAVWKVNIFERFKNNDFQMGYDRTYKQYIQYNNKSSLDYLFPAHIHIGQIRK